jgi:AraC family transcriptional regulator
MEKEQTLTPGRYFGEVKQMQNRSHLILTQTDYQPNEKIPDHCHEQPYFCLTLDGSHRETTAATDIFCQSQSVRFHPPGSVHRNRFEDSGGRCFNIELQTPWQERIAEFNANLLEPKSFEEGSLPFLTYRLFEEFKVEDDLSEIAIEGITLEILAELHRSFKIGKETHRSQWLEKIQSEIEARYLEPLALDELAGLGGVHPVYLARAFRRYYRCSVGEYIRRLRVEHAKKLMISTDHSLGEIALNSGFSDQSHFSKIFKVRTGLTPGQFRKSIR